MSSIETNFQSSGSSFHKNIVISRKDNSWLLLYDKETKTIQQNLFYKYDIKMIKLSNSVINIAL